jgi:hypothetical protein
MSVISAPELGYQSKIEVHNEEQAGDNAFDYLRYFFQKHLFNSRSITLNDSTFNNRPDDSCERSNRGRARIATSLSEHRLLAGAGAHDRRRFRRRSSGRSQSGAAGRRDHVTGWRYFHRQFYFAEQIWVGVDSD